MRLLRTLAIVLIAITFSQCQKDLSDFGGPDPIPVVPVTPDPISARLQGTVLDQNGIPASAVTIKVGSQTATTDVRGYFRIQNATLDKKSSVVTAEKTGFFKAYRTFAATSGTNQVIIKLIPKTLTGTINAASGGNVTLTNGAKIILPANAVVKDADNSNYGGTVNVYAAYIDPTSADINQTVPGSFMADDKDGARVSLASYGMMAVILESTSGEKLQIKSGNTANLTTPIPAGMLSSAPSTIPMWSVNEQTGIWKEEGSATKQGNVYVGEVKHFSFWNCDVPMNAIYLSMTFNTSGKPLAYRNVRITRQNPTQTTYGYTDSLGQVSGYVPANQTLLLELTDQCNNPYFSQSIGPFNSATNLGVINVTPTSSTTTINVTGRLLDCSNNPVTNGFARVYYGYLTSYAATDANGNFSTSFTTCTGSPTTIDILGVDNTNMQQAVVNNISTVTPITAAGNITVCGTSSAQFLNYTLDGTSYSLGATPGDSLVAYTSRNGATVYTTSFNGAQMTPNSVIYFSCNHPTEVAGTYAITSLGVRSFVQTSVDAGSTVTITNYPTLPGQFYEGSFSATFNGGTHTVSGSFKLRR